MKINLKEKRKEEALNIDGSIFEEGDIVHIFYWKDRAKRKLREICGFLVGFDGYSLYVKMDVESIFSWKEISYSKIFKIVKLKQIYSKGVKIDVN